MKLFLKNRLPILFWGVLIKCPDSQVNRAIWAGGTPGVTLPVHDLAGNRIAEHDDTGAVLREYIWLDGRPLAVVEGGQTSSTGTRSCAR